MNVDLARPEVEACDSASGCCLSFGAAALASSCSRCDVVLVVHALLHGHLNERPDLP